MRIGLTCYILLNKYNIVNTVFVRGIMKSKDLFFCTVFQLMHVISWSENLSNANENPFLEAPGLFLTVVNLVQGLDS